MGKKDKSEKYSENKIFAKNSKKENNINNNEGWDTFNKLINNGYHIYINTLLELNCKILNLKET